MIKNVGSIDRLLRFLLGSFLVWLGLWQFNGLQGNLIGILIALASLLPFYMVVTSSCFVFRWFNIHTLSKAERQKHGNPYEKSEGK